MQGASLDMDGWTMRHMRALCLVVAAMAVGISMLASLPVWTRHCVGVGRVYHCIHESEIPAERGDHPGTPLFAPTQGPSTSREALPVEVNAP
jgi:hypothetical protein